MTKAKEFLDQSSSSVADGRKMTMQLAYSIILVLLFLLIYLLQGITRANENRAARTVVGSITSGADRVRQAEVC